MDDLIANFTSEVDSTKLLEQESFLKFYDQHKRKLILDWLKNLSKSAQSKDVLKARDIKIRGDDFFEDLDYDSALNLYNASLPYAKRENEIYSQILQARSKLFYETQEYDNCILDCCLCLNTSCSDKVKLETYVLWVKCLYKANRCEDVEEVMQQAFNYLAQSTHIPNKEIIKRKLMDAKNLKPFALYVKPLNDEEFVAPLGGFNKKFLYASTAVDLKYNSSKGRHVVANLDINPGDVLFVEKAFAFASTFLSEGELHQDKCFLCLKTCEYLIPCETCVPVTYCSEECRLSSWEESHRFECRGIQIGLWYHVGIGFPAFRALLKGAPSGFLNIAGRPEEDTVKFGNEDDNYPFFTKLVSNLEKIDSMIPYAITSIVVICYLESETSFFDEHDASPGVLAWYLMNHMAQFQCNSSSISHDVENVVACGIYPSISMMNHSCKPNVSIEYHRDTAIVRANQKIKKNEEVFNCYGVDCCYDDFQTRQSILQGVYCFTCACETCTLLT